MLTLEQRRSDLQQELDSLVQQLGDLKSRLFDNNAPVSKVSTVSTISSRGGAARRGKRGSLKAKIFAALESAGSFGVKVKDLASALGTKPVNIHSWFHSALKRDKAITKISGGHYRLTSSSAGAQAAAPAPSVTKAAKKTRKGTKRGQLTANILAGLKNAGSKGITVGDLARKVGTNYRNIYVWFATTGKNQPIKKIAPATYSHA